MRISQLAITLTAAAVTLLAVHVGAAQATPGYTCHPKARPTNAQLGVRGDYTVKQGLDNKRFGGFLQRKKIRAKNGCFFPKLRSGQCVTMRFKLGYDKGMSLRGQCVISETGKKFKRARPRRRGPIRGSDMLTKCPNKTGYKCDPGYNSNRAKKWEKQLKAKGKTMVSFCAPKANYNRDKFLNKKVFCQLYDRKSNKVVFATEFTYTQ